MIHDRILWSSCRLIRAATRRNASTGSRAIQRPLRAAYYRGGTSRALIIQPQELPVDRARWPSIFRQLMGSPDPYGRQLDGMGAGISSLSKICLVEPMFDPRNFTIDYTFVGLGIESDEVDVAGNCGNLSSAIGTYAYNAGLLREDVYARGDGPVTVRIRNTNTSKIINSTFDVIRGQAAVQGDYSIDGVSGTGARIKLDFIHPYGSKTGKVLPTGKRVDIGEGGYKITCVDGANPAIFVRADEIGIDGTILPNDFNRLSEKLALLEKIRKSAAIAMGLAKTEGEVARTVPKIGIVSTSSTHRVLSGETIKSSQVDLVVRFISDAQPHRAIPLTMALTTAVAARIPGTVVEELLAPDPVAANAITIGHASGRIQVNASMQKEREWEPESASVFRTAKRIFEGQVYWTDDTGASFDIHRGTDLPRPHSFGLAFVEESRWKDSLRHSSQEVVSPAPGPVNGVVRPTDLARRARASTENLHPPLLKYPSRNSVLTPREQERILYAQKRVQAMAEIKAIKLRARAYGKGINSLRKQLKNMSPRVSPTPRDGR